MNSIYQKAFGNARLYQKISLSNFAKKLSVNKAHISKIENDIEKPSIALLKKLEEMTGFSFWALAKGDFDILNQKNYVKLSSLNFQTMTIKISDLDATQREYLQNKFNTQIKEVKDKIAEAKNNLTKRLEKSALSEGELSVLETELQNAKTILDVLMNTNAPEDIIVHQKERVSKAENNLAEKKRKSGIISDEEAFLEQVMIEELEYKITLRESKIAEMKTIG